MKKFVNNTNPQMKGPEKVTDGSGIETWTAPMSPVVPQDNDKIIDYTRKMFNRTHKKIAKG